MAAPRLAVLVSGSGTILDALTRRVRVTVAVADRRCPALDVARAAGVEARVVERADFGGFGPGFDRVAYTRALSGALADARVDVVAMSGFGTILDPSFFIDFDGRVLNTHPSLLPAFKGWHAVAAALAAGVTETGCTVHVATAALDDGPVLARRRVPVLPGDDEATLHERIKAVERDLYPTLVGRVMDALAAGREPASVAEEDSCGP
ncbi:MAG TPA: phosphoribosylglycinamide formyltransferase [Acidimicrobiales bacterium]|nr:phosphoribosylglycinamide formyltransferase [Acidimicrobiales bacterium]